MVFRYNTPRNSGPLVQGEILSGIWELRPQRPPISTDEGASLEINPMEHPLVVVMTAVCDMEQDFDARFNNPDGAESDPNSPRLVPQTLLCDVYTHEDIRPRFRGMPDVWRRIKQNQDERYHHLNAGDIGDPPTDRLSDLYLDFRKILALPTRSIYEGLELELNRVAVVPDVFIHDLIHRFYGYLSRIGLPA